MQLNSCCTGSQENYFGLVGEQNNDFRAGTFKNSIDHWDKEICAIFGLPIYSKNSAINGLLLFFFDFKDKMKAYFCYHHILLQSYIVTD